MVERRIPRLYALDPGSIESNYRTLEALGAKGDIRRLSEEVQSYWDNLPEEAGEELYPESIDRLVQR